MKNNMLQKYKHDRITMNYVILRTNIRKITII